MVSVDCNVTSLIAFGNFPPLNEKFLENGVTLVSLK